LTLEIETAVEPIGTAVGHGNVHGPFGNAALGLSPQDQPGGATTPDMTARVAQQARSGEEMKSRVDAMLLAAVGDSEMSIE
jgi:hypothetical protein